MSEEKERAESGPAGQKRECWPAWRTVLTDFVIVVLGVGVALAAQQAVEKLHDRDRAIQARASIHGEIADNIARMNLRHSNEGCIGKRLDEIDGLIAGYARGTAPPLTVWVGMPFTYLMHDSKYKAAVQTGAVSLFSDTEQATYADLYAIFSVYWGEGQNEWRIWDDLRTLEKRPAYSPVLDWQLRSAMQHARTARFDIALGRTVALREAAAIGVGPATIKDDNATTVCLPLNTPRAEVEKLAARLGITVPLP